MGTRGAERPETRPHRVPKDRLPRTRARRDRVGMTLTPCPRAGDLMKGLLRIEPVQFFLQGLNLGSCHVVVNRVSTQPCKFVSEFRI